MGRKKVWSNPTPITFNTEDYLYEALMQDEDVKKGGELTIFFNKMILMILGDDNDAVKQFKQEHENY